MRKINRKKMINVLHVMCMFTRLVNGCYITQRGRTSFLTGNKVEKDVRKEKEESLRVYIIFPGGGGKKRYLLLHLTGENSSKREKCAT